ncbi:hypothetical protein EAG_07967 [Camponotus floridanus]|uniref:Uncharacterized protein n=1 Tax=Camponotus floridanus TaxID=104421 RepID=E2ACW2_CAMFO|nr:hypothetical protein EAG_07967 [Camponotus floridanus]
MIERSGGILRDLGSSMTDQGSCHSVKIEEMSFASPLFLNTWFFMVPVPPAEITDPASSS